jgi:hypothetical protein
MVVVDERHADELHCLRRVVVVVVVAAVLQMTDTRVGYSSDDNRVGVGDTVQKLPG